MSKQEPIKAMEIHGEKKKIVLAGNPNVGKSVFFNSLTILMMKTFCSLRKTLRLCVKNQF